MSESFSHFEPERQLQKARSGLPSALETLIIRYRPYLKLLARLKLHGQLRSRLDDSDLVQEACMYAHRDFDKFRGETEEEFTAWLRKIMANLAANCVRDQQRQCRDVRLERQLHRLFDQSSQMMERAVADSYSSPSKHARRRERAVLLANALQELPTDSREVLVLRELEGKSLAEIAQLMDRSVNAVQKLWARSLVQLRRQLKTELELS